MLKFVNNVRINCLAFHHLLDMDVRILLLALLWVGTFFFLGIVANVTVCAVMIRSKRIWKNLSSFLIFHLSLSDLILRLVAMPIGFLVLSASAGSVLWKCKVYIFVLQTCAATIFASLAAIAWERQKNITRPFQRLGSQMKRRFVVTFIWTYALIASAGFLYSTTGRTIQVCPDIGNLTTSNCRMLQLCELQPSRSLRVCISVNFVLGFVVPLLALITSYTRITFALWSRARKRSIHGAVVKSISKSLRMFAIVVLGFVVCWGPHFVVTVLHAYELIDLDKSPWLKPLTFLPQFASSVINPIIYAYYSKDFLSDCRAFCCSSVSICCRRCGGISRRVDCTGHSALHTVKELPSPQNVILQSYKPDICEASPGVSLHG